MKNEFRNKVVVITGATGLGLATSWEFAKQGAKIALLAWCKCGNENNTVCE